MRQSNNILRVHAMTCATTYGQQFTEAIQREYAPLRHAKKILARLSDSSTRAAETWLAGQHAPRLDQAIVLAARCPKLRAELNRLIDAEAAKCGL